MSKSDKLTELENRVAELEQARQKEQRVIATLADHGFSRRQIIGLLGAGAVTFVGTASAAPQTQNEPWHGDFAILLGPDANNDPEEEPTGKRRLMYFGEDTSTIYTTVWDDDTWTQFGTVGGGGGGSAIEYQDDGTSLTTDVALIDAVDGITATEPTADEIQLDITVADFAGAFLQDDGGGDLEVTGDTNALDGSAGTDGQVWTSTGSAAQWEAAPNVPDWTEDGNSPFTATGANNITCDFASTYDVVWTFVQAIDNNGNGNNLDAQIEGDTGSNYAYWDLSGTATTGDSQFTLLAEVTPSDTTTTAILWSQGADQVQVNAGPGSANGSSITRGRNSNVAPPLGQVTYIRGVSTDWTVEVYGRTIS